MVGWYFDVIVGFLIRTVIRFVKLRSSEAWPVEKYNFSRDMSSSSVWGTSRRIGVYVRPQGGILLWRTPESFRADEFSGRLCFSDSCRVADRGARQTNPP